MEKEFLDLTQLKDDENLIYLIKQYEELIEYGDEEEIKMCEAKINQLMKELNIDESSIENN